MERLAFAGALAAALMANANVFAETRPAETAMSCIAGTFDAMLDSSLIDELHSAGIAADTAAADVASDKQTAASVDPRQVLADFAMQLRDIRYRAGGRAPSTGFDCSGFVHYVFAHALGVELPDDSASQYLEGRKVDRAEMMAGDLVFFRTRGKRISHVGIYLGNGRFIHSPATGERVRVNRLDEDYWAHRFAGAKRLPILA